jgi:hypothetical protein
MRILTLVVLAIAVVGCGSANASQPPASVAATACTPVVDRGVLPDWARSGFSDPQPVAPHAVGRAGEIAAILFGDPLSSPPSTSHTNKILWVARQSFGSAPTLKITAQRMNGVAAVGASVESSVDGGPGPSIVDLPDPGCWRLTLDWGDRTDSIDLAYGAPN